MGTGALIHIKEDNKTILTLYRDMDGYPTGLGASIKRILNRGECTIVNGFTNSMECPKEFNSMGCLAAYLTAKLKINKRYSKHVIGNVYAMRPNIKCMGEEYTYVLKEVDGVVWISVNKSAFVKLSEFNPKAYE